MKKQPIKPSGIERAIATLFPQWALKRHQARSAMALSGGYVGGYTGAGYRENMAYWSPGNADADGDTVLSLRELRARSRDLVRNSPIAGGAVETAVTHVIGSGLTMQSSIDGETLGLDDDAVEDWQERTEMLFGMWAESQYCTADGEANFYEAQEVAYRSHLESGDSFALLSTVRRQDWPFTLAVQVIEADRVSNPKFAMDTQDMTQGIERTTAGEAIAVHVSNKHPGAYYDHRGIEWTRVPMRGAQSGRRNVLHLMRKLRPGQTRGVPWLAPIVEPLKQLTRYSTAEVDAAVNNAVIATFVKMDPDTFQEVYDDDAQGTIIANAKRWDGTLKSGAAINLLPGEEIQSNDTGRPNPNFDPFVSAIMRQVGMGLNIPYEVLVKHFQASYSAARAALLDAWRVFRIRRAWMATRFCQPVYEEWLADAVASGLIQAPGFFKDPIIRAAWSRATWTGDGPGAIDPLKEVQAAEARVAMGLTTLPEEVVAYDGGDWQQKHEVQARVQAEREEAGLAAPVAAAPGTPGMPSAPAKPDDSPDDAGDDDGESSGD